MVVLCDFFVVYVFKLYIKGLIYFCREKKLIFNIDLMVFFKKE